MLMLVLILKSSGYVVKKKEINANICFNKRNGDTDRDEHFNQLLYSERYKVKRTNACKRGSSFLIKKCLLRKKISYYCSRGSPTALL